MFFQVMCRARLTRCHDRSAEFDMQRTSGCRSSDALLSLLCGSTDFCRNRCRFSNQFAAAPLSASLSTVQPHFGWHAVQIPSRLAVFLVHWMLSGRFYVSCDFQFVNVGRPAAHVFTRCCFRVLPGYFSTIFPRSYGRV